MQDHPSPPLYLGGGKRAFGDGTILARDGSAEHEEWSRGLATAEWMGFVAVTGSESGTHSPDPPPQTVPRRHQGADGDRSRRRSVPSPWGRQCDRSCGRDSATAEPTTTPTRS